MRDRIRSHPDEPYMYIQLVNSAVSHLPSLRQHKHKHTHYANTPMLYTALFHSCKSDNFQIKIVIFFLFVLKTLIVGTR